MSSNDRRLGCRPPVGREYRPAAARESSKGRPETLSRVGDGQRERRPVDRADGVPRPAKPARQTFRSMSAWLETTCPRRARRRERVG